MSVAFFLGCFVSIDDSGSSDFSNSTVDPEDSPYVASEFADLGTAGEVRWLVEFSKAEDIQFLFSTQGQGEQIQLSIFSSLGDVLWAIETLSPANESFFPSEDCSDYCSFVAKGIVQSSVNDIVLNLHLMTGVHEAVLITPLP
jgi:hypothetical protein